VFSQEIFFVPGSAGTRLASFEFRMGSICSFICVITSVFSSTFKMADIWKTDVRDCKLQINGLVFLSILFWKERSSSSQISSACPKRGLLGLDLTIVKECDVTIKYLIPNTWIRLFQILFLQTGYETCCIMVNFTEKWGVHESSAC